jgi:AcrR family transcriptional regulator
MQNRKLEEIVLGARAVFLERGFAGANMDQIATAAQVSKATIYVYFPSKDSLFREVVKRECDSLAQGLVESLPWQDSIRDSLLSYSRRLIEFVLSDEYLQLYRICVAEAGRIPDVGQLFFSAGPEHVRTALAGFLNGRGQNGELKIADMTLAIDQFMQLSFTGVLTKRLLGIQGQFDSADISEHAIRAVKAFLAIYAVDEAKV